MLQILFHLEMSFSNMNYLTEENNYDLCGDSTSWYTDSRGETGSGVPCRVKNNPGLTKRCQNVLIRDANHIRPREYIHRKKLHRKLPGMTVMGNIDVKNLMEVLNHMIQGESRYLKNLKITHIIPSTTTSVG